MASSQGTPIAGSVKASNGKVSSTAAKAVCSFSGLVGGLHPSPARMRLIPGTSSCVVMVPMASLIRRMVAMTNSSVGLIVFMWVRVSD